LNLYRLKEKFWLLKIKKIVRSTRCENLLKGTGGPRAGLELRV